MKTSRSAVGNVFRAVTRTLIPESAELDEAGWEAVEATVAGSLRGRPPALRRRLRLFLRLIEWAPILRFGRRFTRLDRSRRVRVLSYLQDHDLSALRLGFWGLRTLAFMGFYGRPDVASAIGYRPHPDGWEAWR